MHMKYKDSQAGNVFFLVLVAVALMAAFVFAVTRSGSSSSGAMNENDKIAATRIIAYGTAVKDTIDQMRMQGISENDIRFANPVVNTGYGTMGANPPAEVFNTSGGGLTYEKPDTNWLDSTYSAQDGWGEWRFTGYMAARWTGTPTDPNSSVFCQAANCAELMAVVPYVKKSVCEQIDKILNFWESGAIPQDTANVSLVKFNGNYGNGGHLSTASNTGSWGKLQGCMRGSGSGGGAFPSDAYIYYQILIPR